MAQVTYHVAPANNAALIIGSDLTEMNRTSLKLRASETIKSNTGWASVWRTLKNNDQIAVLVQYGADCIAKASEIADEIVYRLDKTPDLMPEYDLIFRRYLSA